MAGPATPEATIACSLLVDFAAYLQRRGIATDRLCQAALVDPASLAAPQARVPAQVMHRLWQAAEQLTGDADLGLHSAEVYNPGALHIVGYVLLSCATAADALHKLARYAPLLNQGLQVQLLADGHHTRCRFGPAPGTRSVLHQHPRQVSETLAAGIVLTLARLATRPPVPLAVHFSHPAPPSTASHRRVLGLQPLFGQADNVVVYASAALATPMLSADPALLQLFEADATRRLQALAGTSTVRGQVLATVAARLQGSVPSLGEVAQAVAMSTRSLQRALQDEGTAWRDIVDAARRELALAHLGRPGASAAEVAFLLGFSEPAAFSRAFRRWTGVPPSQYRAGPATAGAP